MPIKYVRPRSLGELSNPYDRDEQVMTALVTAGALVALSDGRVDAIERYETVDYIDRCRLAPAISRERMAEVFDGCVRRLQDRDFADLIVEALRPAARLSLTSDVVRIADTAGPAKSTTLATMIVLMDRVLGLMGLLLVAAFAFCTVR